MGAIHEKKTDRSPVPGLHQGFGGGIPDADNRAWRFSQRHKADGICGTTWPVERAVSQAVKRIWVAHATNNLPKGFKLVSVVLPEHQAYIVNKWAETAMKKLEHS